MLCNYIDDTYPAKLTLILLIFTPQWSVG